MMVGITAILFWAVTGRANWYHGIMHHGSWLVSWKVPPPPPHISNPPSHFLPSTTVLHLHDTQRHLATTVDTVHSATLHAFELVDNPWYLGWQQSMIVWLTTIHDSTTVDNNPWFLGWQQSGWFSKRHSRIAAISSDNPILLSEELIALTSTATVM